MTQENPWVRCLIAAWIIAKSHQWQRSRQYQQNWRLSSPRSASDTGRWYVQKQRPARKPCIVLSRLTDTHTHMGITGPGRLSVAKNNLESSLQIIRYHVVQRVKYDLVLCWFFHSNYIAICFWDISTATNRQKTMKALYAPDKDNSISGDPILLHNTVYFCENENIGDMITLLCWQ